MPDLAQELQGAALAVCETDLAHLRKLGLLSPGLAEIGRHIHPFGLMKIADADEGLFYPSPDGRRSLVLPVLEDGELVDLVAFSTTAPDNWKLRTGLGLALGLAEGWHHYWPETVRLHRNPLEWLRSGCDGLCCLDWSAPDIHRFNDLPSITVADEALGRQLAKALVRPVRLVKIHIEQEAARNVA